MFCLQEKITKLKNEVNNFVNKVSTPNTEDSFNTAIGQMEVGNFFVVSFSI